MMCSIGKINQFIHFDLAYFLYLDPFGYSGMRTATLAKFMMNWGNEIFLFINTKRINPALENEQFEDLMRLWFPKRFETLKEEVRKKGCVVVK